MKQSLDSMIGWSQSIPTIVNNLVLTQRGHSGITFGTGVAGEGFCLGVRELEVVLDEKCYLMRSKMRVIGKGVTAL